MCGLCINSNKKLEVFLNIKEYFCNEKTKQATLLKNIENIQLGKKDQQV